MPFERRYEIPFDHLHPQLRKRVDRILKYREDRGLVPIPAVLPKATDFSEQNAFYKAELRDLGKGLRIWKEGGRPRIAASHFDIHDPVAVKNLIHPQFASKHVSEEELRKQFTHMFLKANGSLVLTNPHSAKLLTKDYGGMIKRLRVPLSLRT